jgi:hypothetical protein
VRLVEEAFPSDEVPEVSVEKVPVVLNKLVLVALVKVGLDESVSVFPLHERLELRAMRDDGVV